MAARKARPEASTKSVDDAVTATRRPRISTSSSTAPTASLPGPIEYARKATMRAGTPVACEIDWQSASTRPLPVPSACTCFPSQDSCTLARGPPCEPPAYVIVSSCQLVDGSVMCCSWVERSVGSVQGSIGRLGWLSRAGWPDPASTPRSGGSRLLLLGGQDDLGVAGPVPEDAGGRPGGEQRAHLLGEGVCAVSEQVRRRPGEREVAGQNALGVAEKVGHARKKDRGGSTKTGADQHVLESMVPRPRCALPRAPGGTQVLLDERLDLAVRDRRSGGWCRPASLHGVDDERQGAPGLEHVV